MFIHSRNSLENHTRFQTKMVKVHTRFQTKTAQKPYPLGWHIPSLIKGSTPRGGIRYKVESILLIIVLHEKFLQFD